MMAVEDRGSYLRQKAQPGFLPRLSISGVGLKYGFPCSGTQRNRSTQPLSVAFPTFPSWLGLRVRVALLQTPKVWVSLVDHLVSVTSF